MPLQNRVNPDGQIVAEPWRGTFMGNRGGRIHDPDTKKLLRRSWASKRWIICVTEFKNRQRVVMGKSYTELFFLDEVSALAAGHRPCFECRRQEATRFAQVWQQSHGTIAGSVADGMDHQLHQERTCNFLPQSLKDLSVLPDGTMIKSGSNPFVVYRKNFYRWTGFGYEAHRDTIGEAYLLTPPSIVAVLKNGYQPVWHTSIG
ncbi:MAG: hypothetical protein ACR2O3_10830 [Rhizobiaceae bacterium]